MADNAQAPDVLSTASGGTRIGNLSLAVPELTGKSFPTSPSTSGKRKTSHGKMLFLSCLLFFSRFDGPANEDREERNEISTYIKESKTKIK